MSSSVFFELSLDHLIAMTDLEVTDKALAALRRFGSDGALASPHLADTEQASELLDAIRDVS